MNQTSLFSQPSFEQVTVVASSSPINNVRLSKQSTLLYERLLEGKHVNRCDGSDRGIGTLHSRAAEVRKFLMENFAVVLNSDLVTLRNQYNEEVTVSDYYLTQEDIKKIKTKPI